MLSLADSFLHDPRLQDALQSKRLMEYCSSPGDGPDGTGEKPKHRAVTVRLSVLRETARTPLPGRAGGSRTVQRSPPRRLLRQAAGGRQGRGAGTAEGPKRGGALRPGGADTDETTRAGTETAPRAGAPEPRRRPEAALLTALTIEPEDQHTPPPSPWHFRLAAPSHPGGGDAGKAGGGRRGPGRSSRTRRPLRGTGAKRAGERGWAARPSPPPGAAPHGDGPAPAAGEGWRTCPAWGRGAALAGPRRHAPPGSPSAHLRAPAGVCPAAPRALPAEARAAGPGSYGCRPRGSLGARPPGRGPKGAADERAGMFPSPGLRALV